MLDVGAYMKALEVPALVLSHALFRLSGEEAVAFHVSEWASCVGFPATHSLSSGVGSPIAWGISQLHVCPSLTPNPANLLLLSPSMLFTALL